MSLLIVTADVRRSLTEDRQSSGLKRRTKPRMVTVGTRSSTMKTKKKNRSRTSATLVHSVSHLLPAAQGTVTGSSTPVLVSSFVGRWSLSGSDSRSAVETASSLLSRATTSNAVVARWCRRNNRRIVHTQLVDRWSCTPSPSVCNDETPTWSANDDCCCCCCCCSCSVVDNVTHITPLLKKMQKLCNLHVPSVASPGFVARRGKAGNYVMGHSRRTSGPGAAAARWLIVLWFMQYWSKELWVVDICTWADLADYTIFG